MRCRTPWCTCGGRRRRHRDGEPQTNGGHARNLMHQASGSYNVRQATRLVDMRHRSHMMPSMAERRTQRVKVPQCHSELGTARWRHPE